MAVTAIEPTRQKNYPEWYQQVIQAAELAETSQVRGCMVIRPWGYAIWELIQGDLNRRFKETGHQNAYFPLLIPLEHLEKEAQHIDGFAKECAVVTHHRLTADGQGGLKPDGKLEQPLVIRPTSETIIGETFAKWIQSYRDLPLLINQWANVIRWEMRTRLFLRTSEFLWQEGHTAHETEVEARSETMQMLDIYADFCENILAMPVIKGQKTVAERFPGAVDTFCIEAMMQDGKALQAGTSHFLGQHFSRAADIQFLDREGIQQWAWTTSWGVSTRLIGGLIMTHSDDNGLVLPPRIAPEHIVILPILRKDADTQQVLEYCEQLQQQLSDISYHGAPLRVMIDKRDLRGGEKTWHWIKKGVPLRIEVGPRDIAEDKICLTQRHLDSKQKAFISREQLYSEVVQRLDDMQQYYLDQARNFREQNTVILTDLAQFEAHFSQKDALVGFVKCFAVDNEQLESRIKSLKISARCIPLEQSGETGCCIFTGKPTDTQIIFARSY